MITELPRIIDPLDEDPPTGLNADHPMRQVTRAVAFEPDGWTVERRAEVAHLFDSLADEWHTRDAPDRPAPLLDALDRGLAAAPAAARRVAVDIGAGTGLFSTTLTERFDVVLSVDLACEMLLRAPTGPAHRVQADASVLPVPDSSVDVLLLANAFLFPTEAPRVLSPNGVVIWVNSRGSDTPIHLTAHEVDEALPGSWRGVASEAGWGTWSVHWRG